MNHTSNHGLRVSNLSFSSPHRMPTVSGAQALQDLESSPTRYLPTGLDILDRALKNNEGVVPEGDCQGGIPRGKVTEIYGPPGVGKTAFGLQLVANALHIGEKVVWVDAAHSVSGLRLTQFLKPLQSGLPDTTNSSDRPSVSDLLSNFTHFSAPTLAHLIAICSAPSTNHPPENTGLLVIDSFSTLISNAFPRTEEFKARSKRPTNPNLSSRKLAIIQHLITAFQKLAATRNIALVVLSQCVTKIRPGAGAILVPSINTAAWEQGIGCRLALFRDWGWFGDEDNQVRDVRLAHIIKADGISVPARSPNLVGFGIIENGIISLDLPTAPTVHASGESNLPPGGIRIATATLPQKRKFRATDLEIPDSDGEDDEDYGWAVEDEEDVPPPPPQWQGSEDIMVRAEVELDADEGEDSQEVELEEEGDAGSVLETKHVSSKKEISDSEDELAF